MYNYKKTQVSPHDPTKLAFHSIWRLEDNHISNFVHNFKKTFCFDEIVHFIDEENIMTYVVFDCGFPCYPVNLYKNRTEQPRTELQFQILWETRVQPQQRST